MIHIDTQTMYIHEVSFRNIVLKIYEIPTIYVPKPDSIGYNAYKTIMVIFIWHMKIIFIYLHSHLVIYIHFLQSNDMILSYIWNVNFRSNKNFN